MKKFLFICAILLLPACASSEPTQNAQDIPSFGTMNFETDKAIPLPGTIKDDKGRTMKDAVVKRDNSGQRIGGNSKWREDTDGVFDAYEFEYVGLKQAVARAKCPFTCEDMNIPKERCKTWVSVKDPSLCYVEDLSKNSKAIEWRH